MHKPNRVYTCSQGRLLGTTDETKWNWLVGEASLQAKKRNPDGTNEALTERAALGYVNSNIHAARYKESRTACRVCFFQNAAK